MQHCGPCEKGNKWGETSDCSSLLPRAVSRAWCKEREQSAGSSWVMETEIPVQGSQCGPKLQGRTPKWVELHKENLRSAERASWDLGWGLICKWMPEESTQGWGKNHWKSASPQMTRALTGRESVSVPTGQSRERVRSKRNGGRVLERATIE